MKLVGTAVIGVALVAFAPAARAQDAGVADSDHDGVPDAVDACPMEPGAQSLESDLHGCPSHTSANPFRFRFDRLFFRRGTAELDVDSRAVLSRLVADLRRCPIVTVTLASHTSRAEERRDRTLSLRRAAAIEASLVSQGIAVSRVHRQPLHDRSPAAAGMITEAMLARPDWSQRIDVHIENAADARRCYGPQP